MRQATSKETLMSQEDALQQFREAGYDVLWVAGDKVIARLVTGSKRRPFIEIALWQKYPGESGGWRQNYHATVRQSSVFGVGDFGVNVQGSGPWNSVDDVDLYVVVLNYANAEARARNAGGK